MSSAPSLDRKSVYGKEAVCVLNVPVADDPQVCFGAGHRVILDN